MVCLEIASGFESMELVRLDRMEMDILCRGKLYESLICGCIFCDGCYHSHHLILIPCKVFTGFFR